MEVTSSIQLQDITGDDDERNLPELEIDLDDATVTRQIILKPLPPAPAFAKSSPALPLPTPLPPPPSVARLDAPRRRPSSPVSAPASGLLPIPRMPPPSPLPPAPMSMPMPMPMPSPPPRLAEPVYYAPEPLPRIPSNPVPRFGSDRPPRSSSNPPPSRIRTEPPKATPRPPKITKGEPTISVAAVPPRPAYPTMILPRFTLPKIRLSKRAMRDALTGIGGVLLLTLMTVLGAIAFRNLMSKQSAPDAPTAARMVVTVAGPNGTAIPQASVFVDGKELCRTAPCTIEPLERGIHFVKVVAPGFTEAAARAVTLNPAELRAVHFDMIRIEPPPAPPPPPVATVSPNELPVEPQSEIAATSLAPAAPFAASPRDYAPRDAPRDYAPRDYAPRDYAPPAPRAAVQYSAPMATTGSISMSSNPPSNVVLDGRPLGLTPQRATGVSAGPHSVVFVHSELGRAARRVVIAPGGNQSVSVNFGG